MKHRTFQLIALASLHRVSSRIVAVTVAALAALAWPLGAGAATRYVAADGIDGAACGVAAASACRSITNAINLAAPGDTILVGPGVYGDLNRSGVLGDYPGEETGSAGCGCAVSINKAVIVVSSGGAAVTLIDARNVYLVQNVLLITIGGEFGRPGKGFTVTETTHIGYKTNDGHGIVLDASNVKVRGNRVVYTNEYPTNASIGIYPVNDEPALIEGNQVMRFSIGIVARGGARVSRNEVLFNETGISASTGDVTGNVATQNRTGFWLGGTARASGNAAYVNSSVGIRVQAPFTGSITKNNLIVRQDSIVLTTCGIVNEASSGVKASNNYWGAADGPGALPAAAVCGAGTTITSPYATRPFTVKVVKP